MQLLLFICMSKASKSSHSGEAEVESKKWRQGTELARMVQGPILPEKHICGNLQRWKTTNFPVNKSASRTKVF